MIKIENVKKIILENSVLYYRIKNELFKNEELISTLKEDFFGDFFINKNQIVLQNFYGIINYQEHELFGYYNYNNNDSFTYLSSKDNTLYLEQNGDFVETKIHMNTINVGCVNVTFGGKIIHLFSSYFDNPLWEFSLESLGTYRNFTNEVVGYDVMKFIGEHNNKIIVQLSDATLLFLDITTGKTEKIIQLNNELPILPTCHYDDSFPPHLVGDQLLWLNNQRCITINLNTFEITVIKDYFKETRKEQYRFMHSTYFENKIYFVADIGWQYVVPTMIGVMDVTTGNIIWQQQLQKTGGLPQPPQVTKDKFYIRTTKGTLYIFENEYT